MKGESNFDWNIWNFICSIFSNIKFHNPHIYSYEKLSGSVHGWYTIWKCWWLMYHLACNLRFHMTYPPWSIIWNFNGLFIRSVIKYTLYICTHKWDLYILMTLSNWGPRPLLVLFGVRTDPRWTLGPSPCKKLKLLYTCM